MGIVGTSFIISEQVQQLQRKIEIGMSGPPPPRGGYGGRGGRGGRGNNNMPASGAWQPAAPTSSSLQAAAAGYHPAAYHNPYSGGYAPNPQAAAYGGYHAAAPHQGYRGATAAAYGQPQAGGQPYHGYQQHRGPPPPQAPPQAYAPPQQQAQAAQPRRQLVITDKQGNPIDLSGGKGKPAVTAAAPSSGGGAAAGNKLREAALARIAEGEKAKEAAKKQKEDDTAAKKKEEEDAKKKAEEEEAARKKAEEDAAAKAEEEAAAKKSAEEEAVAKKAAEEEAAKADSHKPDLAAKDKGPSSLQARAAALAAPAAPVALAAPVAPAAAPEMVSSTNGKRRVYSKSDLLRFKEMEVCCCRPPDLPDMTIEKGPMRDQSSSNDRRRGSSWSRGQAPPPSARRQSSQENNRVGHQNQQSQKWSRGQAPPPPPKNNNNNNNQKGGNRRYSQQQDLPSANFKPLVKSENAWVPKKNTSTLVVSEKKVKSILNKMTKEKFERLSTQMCEIPLESYETLTMILRRVYEKAIDEPTFGDMYADLCCSLSKTAGTMSFLHIVVSDEESDNGCPKVYRWSNDVGHADGEIVGPFEDADAALDAALEQSGTPIERGERTLEIVSLRIIRKSFVKVMKDASNDEYFVVYFDISNLEECGQQLSEDFFLSEKECRSDANKNNSFKRSLLNKCEDEFNKKDIYEEWQTEKAAYEENKANLTEAERNETEAELDFRRMKIKKQMLGNIKFIGQLYKKSLLKEKIVRFCIATLLKLDPDETMKSKNGEFKDSKNYDLDEEDHEACCSMFTTIGKTIDKPAGANFMKVCFDKMTKFSKNKNLPARTRFMYKDMLDLRRDNWEPRRKQEKAKTLDEIRKDVEREERMQAQQSSQYNNNKGGRGNNQRGGNRGGRGGYDNNRGGYNDNRDSRRGPDSFSHQGRSNRGPKPTAQIDDDGFTTVASSRNLNIHGGGSSSSNFGRSGGEKGRNSSPKPRSPNRSRSPQPPPSAPAPAAAAAPSAPAPLSREKLERRIDGIRAEFMQDPSNVEELLLSMDEIAGTPDAPLTLVKRNADRIMDCKDAERKAIVTIVVTLFEKNKLSKADVGNGMAEVIEFIDSFVLDSPKAYEYLGDMLSSLLHVKAVDVAWLCEQTEKTKVSPGTDAPERTIKECMLATKSKFGSLEAQSLYSGGADRLAVLLGNDKWNAIASEVLV